MMKVTILARSAWSYFCRHTALVFIFLIAAATFFIDLHIPLVGDDLVYSSVLTGNHPLATNIQEFVRWAGSHWLTANGRLANMLMALLFMLPHIILALLCSVMLWGMYRIALTHSSVGSSRIGVWEVVAISLLLPWWDMSLFDCRLNYVWAATLSLLSLRLMLTARSGHPLHLLLCLPLCFMGGMMHEAASLPLLAGLAIPLVMRRIRLTPSGWWMLAAFALGTATVTFSPGIIHRAAAGNAPDAPFIKLLIVNCSIPLLLWIYIGACILSRRRRAEMTDLLLSPLGVLAIAAAAGTVISVASGIMGRSGWFAQLNAIIVATALISRRFTLRHAWPGALAAGLIVVQLIAVAIRQSSLLTDYQLAIAEYTRLPRSQEEQDYGLVWHDCIRDTELPLWAMGRLRNFPDPDDAWLLHCLAVHYGKQGPRVLPTAARELLPLRQDTTLPCGDRLVKRLPANARIYSDYPEQRIWLIPIETIGLYSPREWIATAIPGGYYLSPRQRDPGDP